MGINHGVAWYILWCLEVRVTFIVQRESGRKRNCARSPYPVERRNERSISGKADWYVDRRVKKKLKESLASLSLRARKKL